MKVRQVADAIGMAVEDGRNDLGSRPYRSHNLYGDPDARGTKQCDAKVECGEVRGRREQC